MTNGWQPVGLGTLFFFHEVLFLHQAGLGTSTHWPAVPSTAGEGNPQSTGVLPAFSVSRWFWVIPDSGVEK